MKSAQFWDWFNGYAIPRLNDPNPRIKINPRIDRVKTFRQMLEHCDQFESVRIVETGCVQDEDNWVGNGCSTLIFDKYVECNGGDLRSVDIDPQIVDHARKLVGPRTTVTCGDSVEYLKTLKMSPDILYLDASHLAWHIELVAQIHHFNELMAIMPRLRPDTLVVADDSPAILDEQMHYTVGGKGGLVAAYANAVGAELVFTDYQTGWKDFPGEVRANDQATDDLVIRARKALEAGNWQSAYELYRNVLVRTPPPWNGIQRIMHGEACAFFARLALKCDRRGTAFDWYSRALDADPRAIDYRAELVKNVMIPLDMMPMARHHAETCTKIDPSDPEGWRMLGTVEGMLGELDRSIAAHSRQIEVSDGASVSMVDKAVTLLDMERYEEADALCDQLLAKPDAKMKGDALHCKAMILSRHGKHEEAIPVYEQALELGSFDPSLVHFHLSLSLFSIGRYKEGWKHQSERKNNRTSPALYTPLRRFSRSLFAMQPPPAKVHVHSESGAGDNLALWRYFPFLLERGYQVRYEVRSDLFKLAKDSLPGVEVVPLAIDYPGALGVSDFDYHCPIGELPSVFGTDIDTIPGGVPYLKADPVVAEKYRDAPKIGLAWSSGIREDTVWLKRYGQLKSLSFNQVRPLIHNLTDFVSLQMGPPRSENDLILNLLPDNADWAETAALVSNLDLVITPDTGLAHLCGAMGVPTWIMMHAHNAGWHFMSERPGALWNGRSPWYPSVRLFRQQPGEGWEPVIQQISAALRGPHLVAAE
jgi:tetratricopeptide (TPR) repeat protein